MITICINRQEFLSWKLPKDCHIIISQNPDDGIYMTNSMDTAMLTRFSTVTMKFDIDCWARQMEREQLDNRCLNFLIKHPELMNDENLKIGVNPRSITNFFNSISSISDFEKNIVRVQQIGEASVGLEVSTLFTTFIVNRLDKLITPKDILTKDWKFVKDNLVECCGKASTYRPDI